MRKKETRGKREKGEVKGPGKKSDEAPRENRGAFVFTDRSGKPHAIPNRKGDAESAPAASTESRGPHRGAGYPRGGKQADRSVSAKGPGKIEIRPSSRSGVPAKFDEESSRGPRGDRPQGRRDRNKGGGRDRDRDSSDRNSRRKPKYKEARAGRSSDTKLKARIDKNRKGFAFLQFENREYEDAFLNPHEAERFFHGDRVEATVTEEGEVVELRVIEHRFSELVGRFYPTGRNGMVVYERKKAREELAVIGDTKSAKTREWVRAKVIFSEDEYGPVTCEILETYGEELPPRADIQMISAEYSLVEEHSLEAVAEAEGFTLDLNDPHRVDLQHVPFITIDGETARDFDDAVYVERNREGGFTLWVAIADVSHYVKPGTALDDEARSRGTSVYFPERAFHMLPRALSENLCSLRPEGPRLTMTSKIDFDRTGKKLRVEVMNSLIQSRRRATYNEIQAEADANIGNASWEFRTHYDLYAILRKRRNERGSIDFDLPEAEVRVEPTGEPISIKNRPRLDAHRLIEEFMIAANESVTEWALERKWPFVYRVHDEPSKQAMVKFRDLCSHYGVEFVLDGKNLADTLNKVVHTIEGNPAQTLLNMALLRSMAQAHYSSVYGEHFGLASKGYTHFTSPIRRYPDLVVHRMLKFAIEMEREGKTLGGEEREEIDIELGEITEHCSYRERIASDAERESIKLKQTRIMLKEIGNEFSAKVIGMMEAGLFAGIDDPFVEGFIAQEAMTDDFYIYNEERQAFVGKRSKRAYKIGDPLHVRVDRVDLDLRRIDLSIVEKVEEK